MNFLLVTQNACKMCSVKHTSLFLVSFFLFFFHKKRARPFHGIPSFLGGGLVARTDQQRLLLNTGRKGQKSCLVFPGPRGNSSQQIVFRRAGERRPGGRADGRAAGGRSVGQRRRGGGWEGSLRRGQGQARRGEAGGDGDKVIQSAAASRPLRCHP